MTKPYLCESCGETDPSNFYGVRKNLCRECLKRNARYEGKIVLKRLKRFRKKINGFTETSKSWVMERGQIPRKESKKLKYKNYVSVIQRNNNGKIINSFPNRIIAAMAFDVSVTFIGKKIQGHLPLDDGSYLENGEIIYQPIVVDNRPKTGSQEYFEENVIANHGDIYLLDRAKYVDNKTYVEIGCKKHGNYFWVQATTLLRRTERNGGAKKNPKVGSCPICREEYFAKIKEDFYIKCRKAHNNEYKYGEYVNLKTPLDVYCEKHGKFTVNPDTHSNGGARCRECYAIKKSNPNIKYVGEQKYYICDMCGDVPVGKNNHGTNGCPRCKKINNDKKNEAIFRKTINKKFGELNDIFITETHIEFRCKIHGTQYKFLRKKWKIKDRKFVCDECRKETELERLRILKEKSVKNLTKRIKKKLTDYNGDYEFIELISDDVNNWKVRVRVNINHSERILCVSTVLRDRLTNDYRKLPKKYLNYEDAKKKIANLGITCFRQYQKWYQRVPQYDLPANIYRHYTDNGGWVSYVDFFGTDVNELMSVGEKRIAEYLKRKNIDFEYQKRYEDCRDINVLPFDFYLPKYNAIIEFDGYQHYYNVKQFGNSLEYTQYHDKIKTQYCATKNINLLRIPYWELEDNVVEWTLDIWITKIAAESTFMSL